jgi:hypothetical protein
LDRRQQWEGNKSSTLGRGGVPKQPTMEQYPDIWYTKTGTLYKQSKWLKVWRRRVLKLYGPELLICRRDTARAHITITLSQIDTVETTKAFEEHAFKIVMKNGEKFYFVADGAQDQQEWMSLLLAYKTAAPLRLSTATDVKGRAFIVGPDQKFYLYENGSKTNKQVLLTFMTQRQRQKLQLADRRSKPFTISVIDNGKTPIIELESDRKSIESINPTGFATSSKK